MDDETRSIIRNVKGPGMDQEPLAHDSELVADTSCANFQSRRTTFCACWSRSARREGCDKWCFHSVVERMCLGRKITNPLGCGEMINGTSSGRIEIRNALEGLSIFKSNGIHRLLRSRNGLHLLIDNSRPFTSWQYFRSSTKNECHAVCRLRSVWVYASAASII